MNISTLLKFPKIRAKCIHYIKHKHFDELDISIPLHNNFWAKLYLNDSYDSFSEIFIQNEYEGFIPDKEINRVIDLGAHHGYFSVWLQCNRPKTKIKSLLVEPSPRCFPVLSELIKRNEYSNSFVFINKCIGNPNEDNILFFDRPHMASSQYKTENSEVPENVSVLLPEDILNWQQPPYDLLKCDIEGSEWDLIEYYSPILIQTKFALIEWHKGRGSLRDFVNKIKKLNFKVIKSSLDSKIEISNSGCPALLLIKNESF